MELTALAIDEIRNLLALRKISAEELVRAHLERIEQKDKEVRAYLTLCPDRALQQAKKIDRLIAAGEPLPPLAGVPAAVKDEIVTRGVRSTCSSRMLENYIPPYDATRSEERRVGKWGV